MILKLKHCMHLVHILPISIMIKTFTYMRKGQKKMKVNRKIADSNKYFFGQCNEHSWTVLEKNICILCTGVKGYSVFQSDFADQFWNIQKHISKYDWLKCRKFYRSNTAIRIIIKANSAILDLRDKFSDSFSDESF